LQELEDYENATVYIECVIHAMVSTDSRRS
jgi:hypothetical protein